MRLEFFGGSDIFALLIKVAFDGWDGRWEMFTYGVGGNARPGSIVVGSNGGNPGRFDRVAGTSMEKCNPVTDSFASNCRIGYMFRGSDGKRSWWSLIKIDGPKTSLAVTYACQDDGVISNN